MKRLFSERKEEMTDNDETNRIPDQSRRKFIKNTGLVVGGVAGGSILGGILTKQSQTNSPSNKSNQDNKENTSAEARMFFTRFEDFLVLEQATERIYPENDNGPGAIELGVPYFIDKQLAGSWGINGNDYRQGTFSNDSPDESYLTRGQLFINGLRKMNALSQERFDVTFDEAEKDQQIEILQDFDDGDVDMKGIPSEGFFALLRETTLEGVYADPLYGGNRNMAGWKMKEYPGPVPSYADQIDSDKFISMDPISLTNYQQKS